MSLQALLRNVWKFPNVERPIRARTPLHPIFRGLDPIVLATVTTLNCGTVWSFLVAIKALVALLNIMINYASVKETNLSHLQEGNIFSQNLFS